MIKKLKPFRNRIAVRTIELCETIHIPDGLEDYDGVRFYCCWYGQLLGHFTIWNDHRPVESSELLEEIVAKLWKQLSRQLFSEYNFSGNPYQQDAKQFVINYLKTLLENEN